MRISKGSTMLVDSIKRNGQSWMDIRPTALSKVLSRYHDNVKGGLERVHFAKHGDYLITELREKRREK